MSKYTLFGKTIEFSDAADRYVLWYQALSPAVRGASNEFAVYYEKSGNISDVLDRYDAILLKITQDWAIDPLFDTLLDIGIYDINRENFEEECWDLTGAEEYFEKIADAYNEIVEGLEDAKSYRAARKASRGRVVGGGFGVGGALKGMATAGAMNAVTGLGHSVVNGIGNIASSIAAASAKKSLYNNESTLEILTNGVRDCVLDIFFAYHDFINECKEEEAWFDGSRFDTEKSDTLLENSVSVPEDKKKELLVKAFMYSPFNEDLLRYIFVHYEEERENIFKIAQKYDVDLNDELLKLLCNEYCEDAENICVIVQNYKPKLNDEQKESILDAFCDKASATLEDYEEKLSEFNRIMKALGVRKSEAFDAYEYAVLDGIAEKYGELPFGKVEDITGAIVACKVSDTTKAEFIYDFDIWELFKAYNVTIPDDEKLMLLYQKYQKICMLGDLSDESLKSHLDALIDAIGFQNENGEIPYAIREAMFECLTGILEAKIKAQNDIDELRKTLSSDVTKTVEEIISDSGVDFMTTSLTYRQSGIQEAAKGLSYCQLAENEHPFIIYDERPLMHAGEYGFCLTDKRFVGNPEYSARYDVPVEAISRFEKKGFLSNKFLLYTKDGVREISADNLSELDKFVACLNRILTVIPQNAEAVITKESTMDRQIWLVSAECLEKSPYLIDYFGMGDKADEILEKSGKTAEKKKILEDCNDDNLSRCDLQTLEQYLQALKSLRIEEELRGELIDKVNMYIELIHSCKDKNTIALVESCEDDLTQFSYNYICKLKVSVETHKFLSEEKKKELLGRITPRLNVLAFLQKLSEAGDDYNRLVGVFANLEKEPIGQEAIAKYRLELTQKIVEVQHQQLNKFTVDIKSMSHAELKKAIAEAAEYNFDKTVLQETLLKLNGRLDEVELQVISEFCVQLTTSSAEKIANFRKMLDDDGFKQENISKFSDQIEKRYNQAVYEETCDRCKQTVISKLVVNKSEMDTLLANFRKCGKTTEDTGPYLERIEGLLTIYSSYESKRNALLQDGHNQLVNFVSQTIINNVLPQIRECYKPEVYIQGTDGLQEYANYDVSKDLYVKDEAPVFYIFQLNGGKEPIPNLSITNNAMYLSKSSASGQIIRVPLETVTGLKPARIFSEIAVSGVGTTGTIYSELPYKAKVCLAEAIYEIVKYAVRIRPQNKQRLECCDNEYAQQLADCFANFPIPNDDQLVLEVQKPNATTCSRQPNVQISSSSVSQSWVCRCGNVNKGNFCSVCGGKKEQSNREWICACGSKNTANFCPACGKRRNDS